MRQFLCDSFPDGSGKLVVTGKNYRYLVKVLRFSEGEELDARLPDGKLVRFYVERVQPQLMSAVLRLVDGADGCSGTTQGVQAFEVQEIADRMPELWLFQFLPKQQKMDLIVRQATECGVRHIVPISGAYSLKGDSSGRKERWERIIREARQQSGSAVATEIKEVLSVRAAAELWTKIAANAASRSETAPVDAANAASRSSADSTDNVGAVSPTASAAGASKSMFKTVAFLLDENPSAGKSSLARANKAEVSAAALAVGCEGGISDEERSVLLEAGFMPLHFTTNILRAETASLYGIAVIQQFLSAD